MPGCNGLPAPPEDSLNVPLEGGLLGPIPAVGTAFDGADAVKQTTKEQIMGIKPYLDWSSCYEKSGNTASQQTTIRTSQ
uniref:Uncharacterized protein n=1 Tax=Oryza nivara TaxID=4536 RepID=A0A0E0IED5_ORYNI